MRNRKCKTIMSMALASAMALSLTACGGDSQGPEFVYVPEFQEIKDENVSYYNMQYVEDFLYYESYSWDEETGESSESIVKYSLADGSSSSMALDLGENISFNEYVVASDGSVCLVCRDYSGEPGPEGYTEPKTLFCKFGADGTQVFSRDMTEILSENPMNSYIQTMALDGEDRAYLATDGGILLFDQEGNYKGSVDTGGNWINSMGRGRDGKVYLSYYDRSTEDYEYVLTGVDFDQKNLGELYHGFFSGNGNGLYAGKDYDFLVSDGSSVYAYDLKTQQGEKLFDWLDSDINGSYATCMGQLEDGRILAVINDWESNDNGIAMLTKTKASELPQRETIVIGSLYGDSFLQSAAVKFNKSNDKYRISVKVYMDRTGSWTEHSMSDALTRLNNDITSNNCPDIIDLRNLNVQRLAAKGVFEDLNSYLEKSSVFGRDDFVDNVMDAFTYDGVLVGIPATFELRTLIGSAADLGGKPGWTIDELIAYADAHPGALLLDYSSKDYILNLCMMFNESAFIDWKTGECKFDTPEFKSVLEFVSRFPDEYQYEEGGESTPTRIQKGEILLDAAYIYDFEEIQLYLEMFGGDIACIGYPTTDGGSGTGLTASQTYAITTKSHQKDGAWEFIESFLTPEEESEDNRRYYRGDFPNNKEQLKKMAEEAVKVEYLTDENGEIIMDEDGEPIIMGTGGGIGYEDGWSYTYRVPTQEEVDIVMGLIDSARPISNSSDEILNIINEEAAAFFAGQKSVDEAASIIQSRINVYVNENR